MKKLALLLLLLPLFALGQIKDTLYFSQPEGGLHSQGVFILNYSGNTEALLKAIQFVGGTDTTVTVEPSTIGTSYIFDGTDRPSVFFEWMKLKVTVAAVPLREDATTLYIEYLNGNNQNYTMMVFSNTASDVDYFFGQMIERSTSRSQPLVDPNRHHKNNDEGKKSK